MKDYYWLNDKSRKFLSKGYLLPGQTVEERIRQIAEYAESILEEEGFADKYESCVKKGWFSVSSPVFANFGAGRGLPISCNGSYISDTTSSILTKTAEIGMLSKYGAGTSAYYGDVRPRGSEISTGGNSSGSVHFMRLVDTVTDVISQGNTRRGSCAAYLPIDHKDIEEFLEIKKEGNEIQGLSIAVCVTDKWLEEMKGGDKEKQRIWKLVFKKRFESGYPYIFFSDNANNYKPQVYKDLDMKIHASNLCVAPETLILTKDGYQVISSLEEKEIEVWNGKQWSKTKVVKTGSNQKLIKVILEDGKSLDCTPYHKFYVRLSYMTWKDKVVEAKDLKAGDILIPDGINNVGDYYDNSIVIQKVLDLDRCDDTYCVNEPLEHKAVFNGILTGNCTEIMLPSSEEETFVCDLGSMNLLHYDEWKNTDAVKIHIRFLDAVMTDYINKTKDIPFLENVNNFARRHRALGLGVLGWHSLLQSKMIPFESMEAKYLNVEMHKYIWEESLAASQELAKRYGEPELLKGRGMRNTTLLAIAPTQSSSIYLGQVSKAKEPFESNYFVNDAAKGKITYKNPYLKKILKKYEKDDAETWKSILIKGGSVQHLDFLSELEKEVFKTFGEISQKEIIIQAAQAQKYIDQGQSINLKIHPDTPLKEVNALVLFAHEMKIKSLYYQRGTNAAQELGRSLMSCKSCEA